MFAAHTLTSGRHIKQSHGCEQVHGAAKPVISRASRSADLYLAGRRTHTMATLDEAVKHLGNLVRKHLFHDMPIKRPLPAGIHHLAQGAVSKDNPAVGI